ncbi:NAD-dependent dihydropyrimidine dehydrogenase subunit PreA [Truepera radiovictrix]|uniref:dihydrouracil dehydrogenase (NAD(+)) n=1 Tax=Truepera radiovictrix (strain DSM 17093 / CIP 108686 / LMG 22925 / RQ-24) TaxID=649638 RepID=D7CUR2_TRURR|nr:NAD-dependent dihydropyrimidine dehydrogenase subunit PreA [Truepera radiovictrix]ADI14053.1 dihydroorotate dehydrogenase family protein [Truepera radiovictrix DSM 17093]WMT57386.1 NAD-dependent dihydropyrimidine dehydrogenase subunit PreA [Truepera radiovictrix]
MADLSTDFCGVKSPNPFWLASAPPTNTAYQVCKAFDYGWGGAVWKTIGTPVLNVSSRYGGWEYGGNKLAAINNIELISDRPLEVNLREIAEVKRLFPDRAVIVSAMFESDPQVWADAVRRIEDTGADAIELNYGCPHGMSERGMGSAVGQVPEYCSMITEWVTSVASVPVIVKLTPNITDIKAPARAAIEGRAAALSLINTINSVIGVDLDAFTLKPNVGGKGGHGGYAGPAVKPIALSMLSEVMQLPETRDFRIPISGMGGIQTWRDAAEFLLLGATSLQVCTAVMHYGFRIIEELTDGLSNWLDDKGAASVRDVIGAAAPRYSPFNQLDLSYKVVARIDPAKCIHCNLCFVACDEGAHQCIDLTVDGVKIDPATYAGPAKTQPVVREDDCVGCNLCSLVCPVDGCITMLEVDSGRESVTWAEITERYPEVTLQWEAMGRYRAEKGIEIH